MQTIGRFYRDSSFNEKIWTRRRVAYLARYVKLDDVYKLRACYFTAMKDPSVIVRTEEEVTHIVEPNVTSRIDVSCSWKPKDLMNKYMTNRENPEEQKSLFAHITNYIARSNWSIGSKPVQPSPYLDVEMSTTQRNILNPTQKDVLLGFISYSVKGKGAVQKIAKRKIDLIEGNINSYSRFLNDPKRLDAIKDHNELCAAVVEVSAELENDKSRKKLKRDRDAVEREQKETEAAKEEVKKKEELRPLLTSYVLKYSNRAKEIGADELHEEIRKDSSLACLKEILVYYYNMKKSESNKTKGKVNLITAFIDKITSQDDVTVED